MLKPLNFVMISPHFPANFETFAVRLKECGFNMLGINDASYEQLSEGLRNSLTEYYRVESHNEYWLELDTKLCTDFNVPSYKNMLAIKMKVQMKEVFRKAG